MLSQSDYSESAPAFKPGVVVKKLQGAYGVRLEGQTVLCAISNKLHKQLVYPIAAPTSVRRRVVAVEKLDVIDPVAIGDYVHVVDAGKDAEGQPRGVIVEILPRRNQLARCSAVPTPGARPFEQVIVANVDQVVAVCPAGQPVQRRWVLDQYLAAAEAADLPAFICLTKGDLADPDRLADERAVYAPLGYPLAVTSALAGEGLPALRQALAGRVSVLVGKSGVGKTTLLNAIQPGLGLQVKAVNAHNQEGRHTTTNLQMIALEGGGSVVDTPGQREFKLWAVDRAVDQLFPEMRPFLGRCKFGADCTHAHEPGCAVRAALAEGRLAESRYQSYLRLLEN
jgi:ribosome biogenesis GTPase / thiamine phosphate phosphatase